MCVHCHHHWRHACAVVVIFLVWFVFFQYFLFLLSIWRHQMAIVPLHCNRRSHILFGVYDLLANDANVWNVVYDRRASHNTLIYVYLFNDADRCEFGGQIEHQWLSLNVLSKIWIEYGHVARRRTKPTHNDRSIIHGETERFKVMFMCYISISLRISHLYFILGKFLSPLEFRFLYSGMNFCLWPLGLHHF